MKASTAATFFDLLAALSPSETPGYVDLRALPQNRTNGVKPVQTFYRASRDEQIAQFLARYADRDLYFGVAVRREAGSGALENCSALWAGFVDSDFKSCGEAEARERLRRFPLQPSAVVSSGGGLHPYYFLREPLDLPIEANRAKSALRRLAVALGGDMAAAEPARILRVPGGSNHKYTPARPVTLEVFEPQRRYNLSELEDLLPPEPASGNGSGTPFALPERIRDGERNTTLYRLGRSLKAKGLSRGGILAALHAENAARCDPPLRDEEVEQTAEHVITQPDQASFNGPRPVTAANAGPPNSNGRARGVWGAARAVTDFVNDAEPEILWLKAPLVAPGSITEIFSPRGLGKTHTAYAVAVELGRQGFRVLLLDRDNSRREVRRRLKAWGAARTPSFKVMLRDDVPPLTDAAQWATFPFQDYDLVIVDSLDASTEGVGEKDSSKPSKAIAPLLDIAHRADGPAILILGNTIKSAQHSRGSGVVEDRADIVYEVRDATDLQPSGSKPWWQELPAAGADAWAERAARRKRRDTYRLAFVNTKCRIGEEPDPFVFEIDLTTAPWSLRDVTADLVRVGGETKTKAQEARVAAQHLAAAGLKDEIERRTEPLTTEDGVAFLRKEYGLKRADARHVVQAETGRLWRVETDPGQRGRPQHLRPVTLTAAAEIPSSETPLFPQAEMLPISADRINGGRRKSGIRQAAPDGSISSEAFRPPSGSEQASEPLPDWVTEGANDPESTDEVDL